MYLCVVADLQRILLWIFKFPRSMECSGRGSGRKDQMFDEKAAAKKKEWEQRVGGYKYPFRTAENI
jgi:hypothetical protein